jgi:predicted TPR repeat methyltransferase
MSDCCDPNGLSGVFTAQRADADARGYRSRGVDAAGGRVVRFLESAGVAGARVLDIGGGVGALALEALARGAAHAENVEISPHYEAAARELAVEKGVADRVTRHVADFVVTESRIAPADFVIVHKVVCCYGDMPALVGAAARHARRALLLTFPAERWWIRVGMRLFGGVPALFRSRFRLYFHEPAAIKREAERAGLRVAADARGLFWQFLAMERR